MSSYFNFTDNGIEFSGFQNVRASLKADWERTFGVQLDDSETSPDGHHLDLEAKTINSVAEMIQGVCANLNRSTASGQYLDFLAEYLGLHRQTVDGEPESDESLRNRMSNANSRGLATYNGMLTYLQNEISPLVGVSCNDSGETDDDGVPGHSIRVTIPTGVSKTADQIAEAIFISKPAGISTNGNKYGTAVDVAGKPHQIYYSTPSTVSVYVSVTVTRYSEEAYPSNGNELIRKNIASWCLDNLSPGKDVIPQRLLIPIFEVPGVESASIKLKKGSGSWVSEPIRIQSQEQASIPVSNITVG